MSESLDGILADSISYTARLPMLWEPRETLPVDPELAAINAANLALLEAIAVIEEKPVPEDNSSVQLDIQRLDAKLDLVISMMGRLLGMQRGLPEPVELTLSASSLHCEAGVLPASGQGCAQVFLSSAVPDALILPATVSGADKVEITALAAPVHAALERLLFRQHRRAVAELRSRDKAKG